MPAVSSVDQSELHRFLVTLPVRSNFDFSSSSRFLIRKTLFLAASGGGSHLHRFFPAIPRNDFHPLETDLHWLLTNYAVWLARFTPAPTHPRCARHIRYGEPVIACYSCATHDSAVLCENCYDGDLHKDHNVVLETCTVRSGITCDCGDPEKWAHPLCPNSSMSTLSRDQDVQLPDPIAPYLLSAIEVALDFAISVLCMADLQYMPRDQCSADAVLTNELESALNPELGGYTTAELDDTESNLLSNGSYSLIAYNDHSHHSRDTIQRVNLASLKLKMFASMVALRIESYGKAKVISSADLPLLLDRQKILSATGLAACIRSDRDDFYESTCDEVLSWICEVVELELVRDNPSIRDQICDILSSPWRLDLLAKPNPCQKYSHEWSKLDSTLMIHYPERVGLALNFLGTRFQYLIYLELNMWKSLRLKLHVMYSTTLIANFKYRPAFGAQYAEIYPQLADILINRDREPEYNVMSLFSRSLLTSLAVTQQIRSGPDLQRMLMVAYNYFSAENVLAPIDATASRSLSMHALKTRRWNQLMADICLILNPRKSASPAFNVMGAIYSLVSLFQGKATMTRAVDSHVEYENPDHASFFHALPSIYSFAFVAAKSMCCIAYPTNVERRVAICDAILGVITQLVLLEGRVCRDMTDEFDTTPPSQKKISFSFATELVEDYSIDTQRVSLVHPLHSVLSWLIDFAKFDSPQQMHLILHSALSAACRDSNIGPCTLASVFEYPVRTVALISQIKSGFWVRNGMSVKTQLQMYRSSSLEKLGYSRDMYLIQVFCTICDPEAVTYMILSRWKLLDLEHGCVESCYDSATRIFMLEECVNFFIHLLTGKYSSTDEADDRYAIEQEILHNLCFGPLSYSNLRSLIPDHIVENKQFEHVLHSMTSYTAPLSATNSGQLVLHESFMDDVDPYFYNYSVNHKEEAIALVKSRMHKKTKLPISQIVLEPPAKSQYSSDALCNVGNVSTSRFFVDHMIRVMKLAVSKTEGASENLVETSLHLIHVCATEQAIERAGAFYERFLEVSASENISLALLLLSMLQDPVYQACHPKIRAIFATLTANHQELPHMLGVEPLAFCVNFVDTCDDSAVAEKKKALAMKRRDKMLAKFKKQQTTFSKNHACGASDTSDTEMTNDDSEHAWMFPEHHCILCQNTMEDAGPFGLISYISFSTEFRNTPFDDKYWMMKAFSDGSSLDRGDKSDDVHTETWYRYMLQIKEKYVIGPGFSLEDELDRKLVTLTCGHGMHHVCYVNHLQNIKSKLSQVTRHTPENSDHQEFLCPLCKSINNFFIPIMWQSNNRKLIDFIGDPSDGCLLATGGNFGGSSATVNAAVLRGILLHIRDTSIMTPSAIQALGSGALSFTSSQSNSMWLVMMRVFDDAWQLCFPHTSGGDYSTLLINSIKSAETSLRGCEAGDSVVDQLSNLNLINLRVASEFRDTVSWLRLAHGNEPRNTVHVKQMALLDSITGTGFNKSVIDADFFGILVNTIPMPTEGVSFHSILSTCFLGHLLQVINIVSAELVRHGFYFGKDYTMFDIPIIKSIHPDHARAARHIFQMVTSDLNTLQIDNERFGAVFYTMIIKACTPFLRRAGIYAFVQCANTDGMTPNSLQVMVEADRLSSMLNISSIGKLLREFTDRDGTSPAKTAIDSFLAYKLSLDGTDQHGRLGSLEYPGIISLVELPTRLDHFFTKYYYLAAFNFPYLTIEDPAVCLLCGEVVDTQKSSPGSDTGQCWTHFAKECGHSVGIFLLPKDKTLLLLHKNGGSFYPLPYADSKGEVLAGSKIQYLIELRYKSFVRDVWLLRNVPNYITRTLDSSVDVGGWETL